jgi:hypothetical protein
MGKTAKKIKLSDKWQGRLKNKYKDGNIQLVNECGLELRKYGYPL